MSWKEALGRLIVPNLFEDLENKANELNTCVINREALSKLNNTLTTELKKTQESVIKLTNDKTLLNKVIKDLKENPLTSLEKYCKEKFKEIPNIAYTNKREFLNKPISVYLNQMITPNSFEVVKYKKGIKLIGDLFIDAKAIGDRVSKDFTWLSDKNLINSVDYYLYPEEIIINKFGDCEDHSFLNASLEPKLGVGYGYLNGGGHAFNVFIYCGELFILETTGNRGNIYKYPNSSYKINYIITKDKTYSLDSSVRFGKLAGWD